MKIWIDLANSPHVLFFSPIINEFEKRGHKVFVTHRDFAQTSSLCKIFNINSYQIGKHGGRGKYKKIKSTFDRAVNLRKFVTDKKIDLAVSHNSYSHCIAAKSKGIPYVTIMDYEYQPANHINFRIADKILTPYTFCLDDIRLYGADKNRLVKYPGLKEDVYLWQFEYINNFWESEFPELNSLKIMCTIRPPATMAAYHDFENPLFYKLIEHLSANKDLQIVVFPRTEKQKKELQERFKDLFLTEKSVPGDQLIAHSDLIISAGGTMNREAAVMGTPAYTIYAGKLGSVDQYLIKKRMIQLIGNEEDFKKLRLKKKLKKSIAVNKRVFDFVVDEILNTVPESLYYTDTSKPY